MCPFLLFSGKPRALELHLDRLVRSATAIDVPLPPRGAIADWITAAANAGGEGSVRLMATKGASKPDQYSKPQVIINTKYEYYPLHSLLLLKYESSARYL